MNKEKLQEQMEIEEAKRIVLEEMHQEEIEKYNKEHIIKCPSCAGIATNLAPNGAGIAGECNWHCDICGWEEVK